MNDDGPKKALGQHWLNDSASLEAMLATAKVGSKEVILEIGPGLGSLTQLLVNKASKVIAVEKDEALAKDLPQKITSGNLKVVTGDILQFDLSSLPNGYKVIANIPYYLTSNLIRVLSDSINPPSVAVLLVQKEVADRLSAKPGQMSILAVTAQFYWEISVGRVVKADLFEPPPKVDSQIVRLVRRPQKLFAVDEKQFFRLIKIGFAHKRKTLANNLMAGYHIDKVTATSWLRETRISSTTRAQTLSLNDWKNLLVVSALLTSKK